MSPQPLDPLLADDYDEFGFYHEIAEEWGLPWKGRPKVRRGEIEVAKDRTLSYLRWGEASPDLVLLHGGGQNAHTWDAVALALGRPLIVFDLPGHGHSGRRADRDYAPWANAETLQPAIQKLAPEAKAVVGMSLGGATTIRLAAQRPDLVRKAVIVDVTPQVNDARRKMSREDRGTVALIAGPPTYATFQEIADAAVALSPYRSARSVVRGVRHNTVRLPDGRWTWRYDLFGPPGSRPANDFTRLWDDVSRMAQPAMLVLGGASKFVTSEDVAEMRRRKPDLRVESVPGAGHAVQSDKPLDLVRLIDEFVFRS